MNKRVSLFLTFMLILSFMAQPVSAQASGPVYIVQSGDTLSSIAARFNVTIGDLETANPSIDPNFISEGQEIVIPGLDGVAGVLETRVVNLGDSFKGFVRHTQVPAEILEKLNHLVSPSELYVGATMIVPAEDDQAELTASTGLASGESLLESAITQNTDPWTLADLNGLAGTWDGLPGDALYAPGSGFAQASVGLPSSFLSVEIPSLPMKQGGTTEILVHTLPGVKLGGSLVDHPLNFFSMQDGTQVALQGVHALLDPGVYPLQLNATLPDGSQQSFEQMVLVVSGNYPKETLSVSTELIDPTVTGPEDEQVAKITAPVTPAQRWQGMFSLPVYVPSGEQPCIYDRFGTRRSFNGSAYDYFHSGIDYGVCFAEHPFDIYAAAPGTVVFSGPLTVRGNATFIDHGEGIYTAYFHQKEIYVSAGQQVQAGELIGQIGDTGRVTGPHLHFEMWAGGVQVDPQDWLDRAHP